MILKLFYMSLGKTEVIFKKKMAGLDNNFSGMNRGKTQIFFFLPLASRI